MTNILWVVVGIVAICLLLLGVQHFEISHLDTELAVSRQQVELFSAANKAFGIELDKQNTAIAALKKKSDDEHQKADAAILKAEKAAAALDTLSNNLNIHPTGNDCVDTAATIDAYFARENEKLTDTLLHFKLLAFRNSYFFKQLRSGNRFKARGS